MVGIVDLFKEYSAQAVWREWPRSAPKLLSLDGQLIIDISEGIVDDGLFAAEMFAGHSLPI